MPMLLAPHDINTLLSTTFHPSPNLAPFPPKPTSQNMSEAKNVPVVEKSTYRDLAAKNPNFTESASSMVPTLHPS